jgi:hypothetical protein
VHTQFARYRCRQHVVLVGKRCAVFGGLSIGAPSLGELQSEIARWYLLEKGSFNPLLFMLIERFRDNDMLPIYQRVRDEGRSLPDGLKYVDSWIEPNFARCFQLMECDDLRLLQQFVLNWRGSGATFEIVPVVGSAATREVVAPFLDKAK